MKVSVDFLTLLMSYVRIVQITRTTLYVVGKERGMLRREEL